MLTSLSIANRRHHEDPIVFPIVLSRARGWIVVVVFLVFVVIIVFLIMTLVEHDVESGCRVVVAKKASQQPRIDTNQTIRMTVYPC